MSAMVLKSLLFRRKRFAVIGTVVHCPECNHPMSNHDDHRHCECLNPYCDIFKVKFRRPTVELERA